MNINLKLFVIGMLVGIGNLQAKNIEIDNVAIQLIRQKQINLFVKNINFLKNFIFNDIKNYGLQNFNLISEDTEMKYYKLSLDKINKNYKIDIKNIINPFTKKDMVNDIQLVYDKNHNNYELIFDNLNISSYYKPMFLKLISANVKFVENNKGNIKQVVYKFLPFENKILDLVVKLNITYLPPSDTNKFWYKYENNKINIYKYKNNKWENIGNILIDNKNLKITSQIFLDEVKDLLKLPTNISLTNVKVLVNNNYYINYIYDKTLQKWVKKEIQDSSFIGNTTIEQLVNELFNSDMNTKFYIDIDGDKYTFVKYILPDGTVVWTTNNETKYLIFDNVFNMLKAFSAKKNINSGVLDDTIVIVKDLYTNNIKKGTFDALLNDNDKLHLTFDDYKKLLDINPSYLEDVILYNVKDHITLVKENDYFKKTDGTLYISLTNRDVFATLKTIPTNNTLFLTKINDCDNASCYTDIPIQYKNGFYYFYFVNNPDVKNKNKLSNIPAYSNVINGINSNNKYFIFIGNNKTGKISYLTVLQKSEVNGQTVYKNYTNNKYINNNGYYFPLNFIPYGINPNITIAYSSSLKMNYLKLNNLKDIILNLQVPQNYPVYFYSIAKLLKKCNSNTEMQTLWSDNCNNIQEAEYAVTSGTRNNIPTPVNTNRINLTYTNETNKLNYYGIKFDKEKDFYQWTYVSNDTINKTSGYYYNDIPLSSYIVNNMVDAKYIDSIWTNQDMDDKIKVDYGNFTPDIFVIDKNGLLGNVNILGLKKYGNIYNYANINFDNIKYAIPENTNIYFPENTDILFPIDINFKFYYKNNYGNNIKVSGISNYNIEKNFNEQYIKIKIGDIENLKKVINDGTYLTEGGTNILTSFNIIIPFDKNSYLDRLIKIIYTGYLKIEVLQPNGIWKEIYTDETLTNDKEKLLSNLKEKEETNIFTPLTENIKNNVINGKINLKITTSKYNLNGIEFYFGRFYFIPHLKDKLDYYDENKNQEYFLKAPSNNVIYYKYHLYNIIDTYGPNIWYK